MRTFSSTLLLLCVLCLRSELYPQSWTKLIPTTSTKPSPRQNASGIYDPVSNSLVIFGGRNDGGSLDDVWSYDLDSLVWSDITPADTPKLAARFAHTAIYDPINHAMVIWSGQGSVFYNDLWTFDLITHTWHQRSPTGTIPTARYGSVAIYNPSAHRMTMFAGFTTSGRFGDTQAYDIALNSWLDLTPSGTNPPQRCLHAACYDEDRHRMIIYGGQNAGPLDDIWAFDLTATTWSNLTPSSRPDGKIFPSSVYIDDKVIVFGGLTVNGNVNETWSFSLPDSTWTLMTPSGTLPEKRNGHAAIVNSQDQSMIIFGGMGDSLHNDVWSLSDVVVDVREPIVPSSTFELYQNYPNPFNPVTKVSFVIRHLSFVSLRVYDIQGEEVATLVNEVQDAGYKSVEWNAGSAASGVYVVELRAGTLTQTRKMVLLR